MPVLVEAFAGFAANRPGLRLRMVGDGHDRRRCEELARQAAGGAGNIEFTGYRTDVDAQLEQADVFVLPSLNENLPLALLQAMAMGLPCIATDVGGIPEVLDADCGILVTPGDVGSLRAAMERMIDEPGLAARLGAMARRRVAERFSLSRCADDHLRLWSEILGNGRQVRILHVLPGLAAGGMEQLAITPGCRCRCARRHRRGGLGAGSMGGAGSAGRCRACGPAGHLTTRRARHGNGNGPPGSVHQEDTAACGACPQRPGRSPGQAGPGERHATRPR